MARFISQFLNQTAIYYGPGSSQFVGREAAKLRITRALIVTDPGVHKAGALNAAEASLNDSKIKYEIFDQVQEDADVNVVHKIACFIRESGCNGVVVVGGGSPICAAKGAAVESTNEVEDVRVFEGSNKYKEPPLPVICIPTTAGSGSDLSDGFPIVDYERRRHFGIRGDNIAPPVSILDPLLLNTCPKNPMIFAGIDALSHALDALWSTGSTPLTDALAYEAIYLIINNLVEATLSDNVAAKTNQHLGSTLAMLACGGSGLAIIHAFAGVVFSAKGPHGYKCGRVLPLALEFNLPLCEVKFARMATMLGEMPANKTNRDLAILFVDRVKQLLCDLDFPGKLDEDNSTKPHIPDIIKEIRENKPPFADSNIRRLTDRDLAKICEAIF